MLKPAVLPKPKNIARTADDATQQAQAQAPVSKSFTFKLLSRDARGRFETRQLELPEDNQMAAKLLKATEAQRAEKQLIKERTLQINQLHAEAEVSSNFILLVALFNSCVTNCWLFLHPNGLIVSITIPCR
jgi:hypothetical protein